MKGKVCLITGATNGIGLETARALAMMKTKIVLIGRDAQKTASVAQKLKQSTGSSHIDTLVGDLSLMSEVRRLADEFQTRYHRLDILINNVGAVFTSRELTSEGFERTFALNHLSHFLLTTLLLDVIVDSAPGRIISVSSEAHRLGNIDFDNLQGEKKYAGFPIYQQSKLMNLLFVYELARRLRDHGVTVNALHPGFVGSGFGMNNPGLLRWMMKIARPFTKTPTQGAATSIYLASSQDVNHVTGAYYVDCVPKQPSKVALDVDNQKRLWDVSVALTGVNTGRY